ncbi:MAG TPA: hypothetical protein VGL13_01995, partial [Polyangiaceae bacterium]
MRALPSSVDRDSPARRWIVTVLSASALWVAGCGGGVPLLHGAHALHDHEVAVGAGFSGTFATGDANDVALRARTAGPNGAATTDIARATAVAMALSPAVAPWVSARVGLHGDNEAGITYTGRAIGVDVRHAFYGEGGIALSVGIGANVVTGTPSDESPSAGDVRLDWRSAGVDVPVLVGWRSAAGIVEAWAGARGGFERVAGDVVLSETDGTSSRMDLL